MIRSSPSATLNKALRSRKVPVIDILVSRLRALVPIQVRHGAMFKTTTSSIEWESNVPLATGLQCCSAIMSVGSRMGEKLLNVVIRCNKVQLRSLADMWGNMI